MYSPINKYSNNMANTELNNKYKVLNDCVNNSDYENMLKAVGIEKLSKTLFLMQGQYGYIIDAINLVCTHDPSLIKNNLSDTHYVMFLTPDDLAKYGLGDFDNSKQKKQFKDEIYKIFNGKEVKKLVPFTIDTELLIDVIRIIPKYSNSVDSKYFNVLSNTEKKELLGFRIEFYKPLWNNLLKSKPDNYFNYTSHLQAKINHAVWKHGDTERFQKYGIFGNTYNFRKYLLYTSLHDNDKSTKKTFDKLDITRACLPSNICIKNDKQYIKNDRTTYNFLAKCILMQHQMSSDGLMYGMRYAPTKLYFQGSEVILHVERNSSEYTSIPNLAIPEYTKK